MAKPTNVPTWADSGTIVEPSSGKKATGWIFEEKPPHEYFNWWQNLLGTWIQWLDTIVDDTIGVVQFQPPPVTSGDGTSVALSGANAVGTNNDGGNCNLKGGSGGGGTGVAGKIYSLNSHDFLDGILVNGSPIAATDIDDDSTIGAGNVAAALSSLDSTISALAGSAISNDSGVSGASVTDALNTLNTSIVAAGALRSIFGFAISTPLAPPTTKVDVHPGFARDSSNTVNIEMTGTLIKDLGATWVQGNNLGGRGGALTSNSWYYIFAIYKAGQPVDIGFDLDINAANLLAASTYTHYRRIGCIWYDASAVRETRSQEDHFFFYNDHPYENLAFTGAGFVAGSVQMYPPGIAEDFGGGWVYTEAPTDSGVYVVTSFNSLSSDWFRSASVSYCDAKYDTDGRKNLPITYKPYPPDSSGQQGIIAITHDPAAFSTGTIRVGVLGYVDHRGKPKY